MPNSELVVAGVRVTKLKGNVKRLAHPGGAVAYETAQDRNAFRDALQRQVQDATRALADFNQMEASFNQLREVE